MGEKSSRPFIRYRSDLRLNVFGLKRPQILRSIIFPSVFSCSQRQLPPLDTFAEVTHLLVIFGVEDDDGNFTFPLIALKTPKDTSK